VFSQEEKGRGCAQYYTKRVYLHAPPETIYPVDPFHGVQDGMKPSRQKVAPSRHANLNRDLDHFSALDCGLKQEGLRY
jgi:hypothetical protein